MDYASNIIAENMLSQVDSEGFITTLMESIVDHRKDEATAVPKAEKYIITQRGQQQLKNIQ
jgi:hypothetical protein